MFTLDKSYVTVIRKRRPEWQTGLLNGVGGKIEDHEVAAEAMAREFQEETGVDIVAPDWERALVLIYPECTVNFFRTRQPDRMFKHLRSKTDEEVLTMETATLLWHHSHELIPNLQWIIPFLIWHERIRDLPIKILMEETAYATAGKT
jgi:8-oxo-dGTP diphosphatase